MGQFEIYTPLDSQNCIQRKEMIIDSITIANLKLLNEIGSLQRTLDHCQTAFGKRCAFSKKFYLTRKVLFLLEFLDC